MLVFCCFLLVFILILFSLKFGFHLLITVIPVVPNLSNRNQKPLVSVFVFLLDDITSKDTGLFLCAFSSETRHVCLQGGVLVVGGNSKYEVPLQLHSIARYQQSVLGVHRGTRSQLSELVQLVADKQVGTELTSCCSTVLTVASLVISVHVNMPTESHAWPFHNLRLDSHFVVDFTILFTVSLVYKRNLSPHCSVCTVQLA